MSNNSVPLTIKVWGEWACFTRPEMKVERVTYPVMTPSAARGVLEAVFWKPEFTWRVEEIWVLKPIRYASILRNEINTRQSERTARSWQADGGGYDASADRAQRHTLALRDVAYLIRAQVELKPHADADPAKYRDQFRRRVASGRCFNTPYLGCREFSAAFALPDGSEQPVDLSDDLGPMLLDLNYQPDTSGRGTPHFFNARLDAGVLRVPPWGGV
ncbi:MAG: type I-C CRISPR-associated protein Cas5c [Chloroflexales bacterium]|nr:type I-C CRISPR-associated protein Cas5c [Chloroflexales bacterium]